MVRRRNFPITKNFRLTEDIWQHLEALSRHGKQTSSAIIRQLIEREYHTTFPEQPSSPPPKKP
jgi:predicted DNA-binding protein